MLNEIRKIKISIARKEIIKEKNLLVIEKQNKYVKK